MQKIIEAAGIAREKVEELCKLIPGLRNEIDWSRGASKASKNEVEYKFKDGSKLDIIAASQNSRGKRATGKYNCPFKIAEKTWKAKLLNKQANQR